MPTIAKTFGTENKKKLNPTDFYETPIPLAVRGIEIANRYWHQSDWARDPVGEPNRVLDPSMGTGPYGVAGKIVLPNATVYGLDIQYRDQIDPAVYRRIRRLSFLDMPVPKDEKTRWKYWPQRFDLIVTNPPFSLAEEFINKGLELLVSGGVLCLLLKAEFYCGMGRNERLFNAGKHPHYIVVPYRTRVSFDGTGRSNTHDYVYYVWQNEPGGHFSDTEIIWETKEEDWNPPYQKM